MHRSSSSNRLEAASVGPRGPPLTVQLLQPSPSPLDHFSHTCRTGASDKAAAFHILDGIQSGAQQFLRHVHFYPKRLQARPVQRSRPIASQGICSSWARSTSLPTSFLAGRKGQALAAYQLVCQLGHGGKAFAGHIQSALPIHFQSAYNPLQEIGAVHNSLRDFIVQADHKAGSRPLPGV